MPIVRLTFLAMRLLVVPRARHHQCIVQLCLMGAHDHVMQSPLAISVIPRKWGLQSLDFRMILSYINSNAL
jgi:hypothetical protein